MRLRIHRGTQEIGGTCIEAEAQGKRIVLDVGLPLDAPDEGQETLLPEVPGFRDPDDTLLGVMISHGHMDHYGLAAHIRPEIPVWIGEAGHNILKAASAWVPNGHAFADPHFLADRRPVEIGPFRVTPFLVDHSAFDAYALLVEADGKRVFYSGDFRAHGRKAALFERLVSDPPADIDVLLMEGTTLGRTGTEEGFETESDLEARFVKAFRRTEGMHFVWTSSQNIDRIVTIFRAAKKSGRMLLIDLYTAVVLEATGRDTIPQSHWPEVKLCVPQRQRVFIKENGLFADLERHGRNRVFPEALPDLAERAVMLFRPLAMSDRGVAAVLDGAGFSYSMWQGYLKEDSSQRVLRWLERNGVSWASIHTSGHASTADLQRFAAALAPRALVPIHSFETGRFPDFFDNVVPREDGEWWGG
ncbi:MAG: MBL fold metallo-hydrolase [Alphaproteobacteria bacterium]|nr:MBL fold metallo-hydrolase [Alphaproteobacteria bacterium]